MNEEIKDQLKEITKQLNGKIVYYNCSDLNSQHQKIEIIYDRNTK